MDGVLLMNLLRLLPAVDELQKSEKFNEIKEIYHITKDKLTNLLGDAIQQVRQKMLAGTITKEDLEEQDISSIIFYTLENILQQEFDRTLIPVINATGVVLHTNLGRARISEDAIQHIKKVGESYSTLEFNVKSGKRGSRHDIVEKYLQKLTGAEAAIVVNNNAAAVYLTLRALAFGQEVIVSRGELIEIGGSFRISEIMAESGASLVGVGTTNKTYPADYERAITEETALLMKVHKSNFEIVGFSAEVDTKQLLPVAKKYGIPIYEDLGSGTLFDFKQEGIGSEPTVQEKVASGIDLISFSGDKLLGGPQAGMIVGKKKYIDQLKSHQLARVLRVDKFTLAALESTLITYLKGQEKEDIPTVRDILTKSEEVLKRAESFVEQLSGATTAYSYNITKDYSKVGGGTMPTEQLETYVVEVAHQNLTSTELANQLRNNSIPIIVRLRDDQVIVDFRTVREDEIDVVVEGFIQVLKRGK